jgi:hypothetical protein
VYFRVRRQMNDQIDTVWIMDMTDALIEVLVGRAQILEQCFDSVGPGVGPDIDAKHEMPFIQ